MTDGIWSGFLDVARVLFMGGVAAFVFIQARDAINSSSELRVVGKGLLWCSGIALFAAFALGSASCEEVSDPLRGGCESYADDEYKPSIEQQSEQFTRVFLLLFLPVVAAALDSKSRKRRGY